MEMGLVEKVAREVRRIKHQQERIREMRNLYEDANNELRDALDKGDDEVADSCRGAMKYANVMIKKYDLIIQKMVKSLEDL